jgi:hypothetical protein
MFLLQESLEFLQCMHDVAGRTADMRVEIVIDVGVVAEDLVHEGSDHAKLIVSFQADGKPFDGHGVQPDVVVQPAPGFFIGAEDNVLDAAIKRLQGSK